MSRRLDTDVAIIGGGVIGLACAYELLKQGKRVLILERDRAGSGAGNVAAGMLAPIAEADTEEQAFIDLALESCALYPEWVRDIERDSGETCGYRDEGSLMIALHRDHEVEFERLAAIQHRMGLEARHISREQALEAEPYLSPRVVSGLLVPNDRQVNPRRLTHALAAAVRALGGEIFEGEAASPILEGRRATGASTATFEVHSEAIVVAAGAWSAEAWPAQAGVLPIRPVKGQILRLHGEPVIDHIVRTPDVYLVPRADGELVVGATMEEQGFDDRVTTWAVMDLLREAWRLVPGVAELEMKEASVGFRPALRDNLPAIGRTSVDGLFVATGHYRHGIVLSPITARLLAGVIEGTGSVPAEFDPLRLAAASIGAMES
ncbi:MAG TPA: glycine oxidase ThiO [Dehalococcoidia bacterium]|nr:glycine oxidase ThiO [Dehalococcoidia bacterium]